MLFHNNYKTTTPKRTLGGRLFGWSRFYFFYHLCARILKKIGERHRRGCGSLEDVYAGSWEILKLAENCGAKVEASGIENIRKTKGPVIFIGNHMSMLETVLLPYFIMPAKNITFVVKEQLLNTLVISDVLNIMQCIGMTRKDPVKDLKTMLTHGKKAVGDGKSIIVFPQTSRSTSFDPKHFSSAGIKMARKFKIPIIPVALKTDFTENGRIIKGFGPLNPKNKVLFEFGEPRYIDGNGKDDHQYVIDFISSRLNQWQNSN